MPLAETSPVRQLRLRHQLTQKQVAEGTGLSESTVGNIERLRNPAWVEILTLQGVDPTLTTLEVVVRIAAFFGAIDYRQDYSPKEVVTALKREARRNGLRPLFTKEGISSKIRPCKHPYPDVSEHRPVRRRRRRAVVAA